MATDLREQQGRTLRQEAIRPGRIESGPRWPFVAAGVVLVVLAAVAVLVFTEGRQQPVFGAGHWAETVEGMNTGAREGSSFAPAAGPVSVTYPHGLENPGAYLRMTDAGAYATGALTENREGSGYASVAWTDAHELPGSARYADGALTEAREG